MTIFRDIKQLAPKDASRNQTKINSLRELRRIELEEKRVYSMQSGRRSFNKATAINRNLKRRLKRLLVDFE